MTEQSKITPFLWFDNNAQEAANHYISIFKNGRILSDSGMIVTFEIEGQRFHALNGGPKFKFNEAISLSVDCETQEEVDELWEKLTADGGEPGMCAWLKDKYGLSWQIVPKQLGELLGDPDREKAQRVMDAMLQMQKIIIADLQAAYDAA